MADSLMIPPPLADRIRGVAERENRSVEELLADMLARYQTSLSDDEVDAQLAASDITLPVDDGTPPPLSPEEQQALADQIGRAGSLSTLIIEERSEGP